MDAIWPKEFTGSLGHFYIILSKIILVIYLGRIPVSNPVNLIASHISTSPCNSPGQLLYNYLAENTVVRINNFQEYCRSFGVDMFAEEILDLLASDQNYVFTESADKTGRFWSVAINDGKQYRQESKKPIDEISCIVQMMSGLDIQD